MILPEPIVILHVNLYSEEERREKRESRFYKTEDGINFEYVKQEETEISQGVWKPNGTLTETIRSRLYHDLDSRSERKLRRRLDANWKKYVSSIQAIMFLNEIAGLPKDEKTAILSILVYMARPAGRLIQ